MRSISNTADQAVEQVKDTAAQAKGSIVELGTQIFRFMNTLRDMEIRGADRILDRVGLQRRSSPFMPAVWFAAGALAGGAAAVALSPLSGKDLRKRLAQLLDQGIEEAKHVGKEAETKIEGVMQDAKKTATSAASNVEGALHDAKKTATSAASNVEARVNNAFDEQKRNGPKTEQHTGR
jgi:gas vesicle protein